MNSISHQQQEQTIQELKRRVTLLDEYSSTLQRQNFAKNNQTTTLYIQLDEIRAQNDILRSHLSRINQQNIQRQRKQQSLKQIQKINTSVNSSVEISNYQQEQSSIQVKDKDLKDIRDTQLQITVSCQTQSTADNDLDMNTIHSTCTQQIQQLLLTITQKDIKLQQLNRQSQQMYDTIIHLEDQNQTLKRELQQQHQEKQQTHLLEQENSSLRTLLQQSQTKFKTQSKQLKSYQLEIQQLRTILEEQRQTIENQKKQIQQHLNTSSIAEHQVDRLVRDNNRLIQKIRMLEKQKNTFYAELRGRNVSPLKTSQISARLTNMPTQKKSFINANTYQASSEQKQQQTQRFSSQFGIGKQKQKLKADRWRKIQEKINRVKEENQQLKANLTIY